MKAPSIGTGLDGIEKNFSLYAIRNCSIPASEDSQLQITSKSLLFSQPLLEKK